MIEPTLKSPPAGCSDEKLIRLYLDQPFKVGNDWKIPEEEYRYYSKIHRKKGRVQLFNRVGQEALGHLENQRFVIESVQNNVTPFYHLKMAIALPDAAIIPVLIRGLSELGVEELIFFRGERSQASAKRQKSFASERWNKLAIESARQSGRGRPLEIRFSSHWLDELKNVEMRWFFDESDFFQKTAGGAALLDSASSTKYSEGRVLSAIAVVGCEGGWTEQERDQARKASFSFIHFLTPILRVETAAVCAGFFAIERMLGARHENT